MDLILLGMKLKEDPRTFRPEYMRELRALEALLSLHEPPVRQIKPILPFFIKNCHVEPAQTVRLLLLALETVKDIKVKKSILRGLVLVRQKGCIASRDLFRHVLLNGCDLSSYLRSCQEFLDASCYDVLVEWYRKGTEKQKSFCYYFLVYLFVIVTGGARAGESSDDSGEDSSIELEDVELEDDEAADTKKFRANDADAVERERTPGELSPEEQTAMRRALEEIICEAFFGTDKITKICLLYFLNRTEIAFDISLLERGAEYAKRMYRELANDHLDRDIKIMKLRVFVLFKKHFKVRKSITSIVLKMIDLEKEDLGELLDCLVSSVERHEAHAVCKVISEEFASENKDDDVICYGFNVMREVYCRLAGVLKPSNICANDELEMELSEESSEVDFNDNDDAIDNDNAIDDGEENDTPVNEKESLDPFVEGLRKLILDYVFPFKGNRTKSIRYAYKALIKAVMKHEGTDRATTFVLKAKTKEERETLRKKNSEERRREIAKEQREKKLKKNRKGRKTSKKNKLLRPTKKKTKRS
ncbi:hypothetical protein PAPHI01_1962 [Pancytospora philotis]|nr:hypothetical protein PAPHI01_1962 [Pancytospora philotis]